MKAAHQLITTAVAGAFGPILMDNYNLNRFMHADDPDFSGTAKNGATIDTGRPRNVKASRTRQQNKQWSEYGDFHNIPSHHT